VLAEAEAVNFDSGRSGRRFLVDYSDVTSFQLNVERLAGLARANEVSGHRVAVCAPTDFLFAVNRQALLMATVREGESASVFRDLEDARTWLMAS
jgi:hypothetical protein